MALTCSVYVISMSGEVQTRDLIPIDQQSRITIEGRKFGPEFWNH